MINDDDNDDENRLTYVYVCIGPGHFSIAQRYRLRRY